MAKAWQGRLPGKTDHRVEKFTESISFDHRLYAHDIEASIAHATMLGEVGLLTAEETSQITEALSSIGEEIGEGRLELDISLEDIHSNIESELIRRLGDVGRKLHTARSRNDQVVTDLKLWTKEQLDLLDGKLLQVQKSLLVAARGSKDLIIPAYTHLQRAQPVLAAHYFLAYIEKFERDRGRVADCRRRTNVLPLGSAALAGTSLPIDRRAVQQLLGFEEVAANSLDVSSDRDFVLETVFVLTLIAEHLSTWAEEWVLWSTTEFDFLRLPDEFCTGSSIMPQKKNPDVLELIRGKTARVIGDLQTLLVLVKGLPMAYNRDLQEDKLPLFDAMDTVLASLELSAAIIERAELNRSTIQSRLEEGHLDATTLMEQLILHGIPMRSAHEEVGKLVRKCLAESCRLSDLDPALFEEIAPGSSKVILGALGATNAVQAFRSEGSTAPAEVQKQLDVWTRKLE